MSDKYLFRRLPALLDLPKMPFFTEEIPDARLAAVEQVGDELFLRYQIDWPG